LIAKYISYGLSLCLVLSSCVAVPVTKEKYHSDCDLYYKEAEIAVDTSFFNGDWSGCDETDECMIMFAFGFAMGPLHWKHCAKKG